MSDNDFFMDIEKRITEALNEKFAGKKIRIEGARLDSRIVTVVKASIECLNNSYVLVLEVKNFPKKSLKRIFVPMPYGVTSGKYNAMLGRYISGNSYITTSKSKDDDTDTGMMITAEFFNKGDHAIAS